MWGLGCPLVTQYLRSSRVFFSQFSFPSMRIDGFVNQSSQLSFETPLIANHSLCSSSLVGFGGEIDLRNATCYCLYVCAITGGIEPRIKTLPQSSSPPNCPSCLHHLQRVRSDSVLTLFFVPIWTVSKGQEFWMCMSCGWTGMDMDLHGIALTGVNGRRRLMATCSVCGARADEGWRFCPYCGTRM